MTCQTCQQPLELPAQIDPAQGGKIHCRHCQRQVWLTPAALLRDKLKKNLRLGAEETREILEKLQPQWEEMPLFSFTFDNYYDLLHVSRQATKAEIVKAAGKRIQALQRQALHGDTEANQRLALINEAREVLSDAQKRAEYDERAETLFLALQDPLPQRGRDRESRLKKLAECLSETPQRPPGPPNYFQEKTFSAEPHTNPLLEELLKN